MELLEVFLIITLAAGYAAFMVGFLHAARGCKTHKDLGWAYYPVTALSMLILAPVIFVSVLYGFGKHSGKYDV